MSVSGPDSRINRDPEILGALQILKNKGYTLSEVVEAFDALENTVEIPLDEKPHEAIGRIARAERAKREGRLAANGIR